MDIKFIGLMGQITMTFLFLSQFGTLSPGLAVIQTITGVVYVLGIGASFTGIWKISSSEVSADWQDDYTVAMILMWAAIGAFKLGLN